MGIHCQKREWKNSWPSELFKPVASMSKYTSVLISVIVISLPWKIFPVWPVSSGGQSTWAPDLRTPVYIIYTPHILLSRQISLQESKFNLLERHLCSESKLTHCNWYIQNSWKNFMDLSLKAYLHGTFCIHFVYLVIHSIHYLWCLP